MLRLASDSMVLAVLLRLLLEYLGVYYDQIRYEGPEDRKKWNEEIKPELIKKNRAITLPYLIDGDRLIT